MGCNGPIYLAMCTVPIHLRCIASFYTHNISESSPFSAERLLMQCVGDPLDRGGILVYQGID